MSNVSRVLPWWERLLTREKLSFLAFAWTALSLFVYVFLSGSAQDTDRPFWYRILTAYILQNIPTLFSGVLCIRNGLSSRMPSGNKVWLFIGIALLSYATGSVFFSSWELLWNLSSIGCLGDPFFVLFYICLAIALLMAIVNKQIRLDITQWAIVIAVGISASTIVTWILEPPANSSAEAVSVVAQAQTTPDLSILPVTTTINTATIDTENEISVPSTASTAKVPKWVMFFDGIFKPYGQALNAFYVWSDVFLFVSATVLTLAFWGGRLSEAWQVNAQAIFCYYIADMWFAYAGNQIPDYQAGFVLEVFWIFGAILFGVAATTEFEHTLVRQQDLRIGSK